MRAKEAIDVSNPPQAITLKKIKSKVAWIKVVKTIGGGVSIHIESSLNLGDPLCVDLS